MKFFLLPLSLFLCLACFCQPGSKTMKGGTKQKLLNNDSVIIKLKQIQDSAAKTLQNPVSDHVEESIDRNMEFILRLQKEQRAKQKKAAITRIAIGVALLIVLIIGLMRRRGPSRSL